MAKYTESDIRQLAGRNYSTLDPYQKRLVRGFNQGLSRSQSRGHARVTKGETPVSVIRQTVSPIKPATPKPPKISKRFQTLGSGTKVVSTYSTEQVARSLTGRVKGTKQGTHARIYFQVWSKDKGKFVSVYYGRQGKTGFHGMTIDYFMEKVDEKLLSGQASSVDAAIRQVISEDSASGGGVDSPGGEEVEYDFSQIVMYIRGA